MDTIFAPSSAAGQAGVAVIRISGPQVLKVAQLLCHLENPTPRHAYFKTICVDDEPVDKALVLYFNAPFSFTGEDTLEIQCHGSRAVLKKLLEALCHIPGCRMAEPGEFTRRAVYHNKMDLTAAEGLLDLIHADTEAQRRSALRQMGGELQRLYDGWRDELVHSLAYIEAFIDFPEEEIPSSQIDTLHQNIHNVITSLKQHLNDRHRGERLQDGFQVAIIGAPNVGKSSLLNALAKRDVAIVSGTAGTTRDIVEVYLDIKGYPVVIADTAGLRQTAEEIEAEGIKRALKRASQADLLIAVGDAAQYPVLDEQTQKAMEKHPSSVLIWNKKDTATLPAEVFSVSATTGEGIDAFMAIVADKVEDLMGGSSEPLLTRLRYRQALEECLASLEHALTVSEIELKAEDLRLAARALGKITGRVEVSELFDIIFSSFCIGK